MRWPKYSSRSCRFLMGHSRVSQVEGTDGEGSKRFSCNNTNLEEVSIFLGGGCWCPVLRHCRMCR